MAISAGQTTHCLPAREFETQSAAYPQFAPDPAVAACRYYRCHGRSQRPGDNYSCSSAALHGGHGRRNSWRLHPRLGPASGGPINVVAAPGANNGGGAAPAAAALAVAPAGGRGRSRSRPKRDQPLPPPTAEGQRIKALARQVRELQRRLDLAYAELSHYRRGGITRAAQNAPRDGPRPCRRPRTGRCRG